ncbi:MAG: hypothetical protein ACOZNI_20150 [Myxococcota bacterium]
MPTAGEAPEATRWKHMQDPRYLPEPGGDLVLHVDRHALRLVRVQRDQLRFVLDLKIDDEPPEHVIARIGDAADAYEPDRLLVSVTTRAHDAHWLRRFTHDVLALTRARQIPVVEVPDLVRLGRFLGRSRGDRRSTGPGVCPPAPPAPAPAADPSPRTKAETKHLPYVPPALSALPA